MTKLKIGIVGAIVVAGVAIPWVMQRQTQNKLSAANDALRQQMEQNNQLTTENERLGKLLTQANTQSPSSNSPSLELLKLRGEVGRLRQESASEKVKTNGPSALSGLTKSPEMWKLIRDQQKMGLSMIYKDLTNRVHLSPEQAEKLVELLADNVMENIDRITEVLRDGKGPAQMEQVFAEQETALSGKIQALLGPEGLAQYQDYTRNLGSYLTAEQFKGKLTGDKEVKDQKSKQLYQLMQEETQKALTDARLSPDYQIAPTLNFRNFASEAESEKNLTLLNGIYERVTERASSFLGSEEISQFGEFRTNVINGNRMALMMNRKMMSPAPK